ncbi:putative F-box/LRR-repeat protein at5g41840 [Phtheirospermum japonicum]|uniref:Putative F-box/LRR-repeat protein at5g41840 n=1 Tax=Phtheirospermum japonicum TaxID=374723 RepID=A0A830CSU6_9LAMI|nr:putative F-box/LRR-repeat protein at5g41840 [Phtheirospermum japonicum]
MGERRTNQAINGEFELPKHIIQRIQSFLTGKKAAQTITLSKSWHSAWLTRPNLYFDETDFEISDEFSNTTNKTIQRYEQSNRQIESLTLYIKRQYSWTNRSDLASELIVRALKIGATHLNLQLEDHDFALPQEVFGSENLVGLTVRGGQIDLEMGQKVSCPRLESLSLSKLKIRSEMISKITSNCPLIKKLSFSDIRGFEFPTVVPIDLSRLHELRCLVLCDVKFDVLCLADLSCRFSSLEDLTLKRCPTVREVCSRSLKRLTFAQDDRSSVEFDVPSIRKVTFEVDKCIPSVCFKSTSSEYWESYVSINYKNLLYTEWFLELNKLLTRLRGSKISISLRVHCTEGFDYKMADIEGLSKPEVEDLTVNIDYIPSLTCSALFDGLFRLCRPKFITQYLLPESYYRWKTNNYFLFKTFFVEQVNKKCWVSRHFMYGLHDLKEASVQLFDEDVAVWRDLPLESYLDASKSPKEKQKIRFKLEWKQ